MIADEIPTDKLHLVIDGRWVKPFDWVEMPVFKDFRTAAQTVPELLGEEAVALFKDFDAEAAWKAQQPIFENQHSAADILDLWIDVSASFFDEWEKEKQDVACNNLAEACLYFLKNGQKEKAFSFHWLWLLHKPPICCLDAV